MTIVKVAIPEILSKFRDIEKKDILLRAIRHVTAKKLEEEKKEAKDALKHIRKYEKKYRMNFLKFEKNMPKKGDATMHEDWIDWSFWNDVYKRTAQDISKYQDLINK